MANRDSLAQKLLSLGNREICLLLPVVERPQGETLLVIHGQNIYTYYVASLCRCNPGNSLTFVTGCGAFKKRLSTLGLKHWFYIQNVWYGLKPNNLRLQWCCLNSGNFHCIVLLLLRYQSILNWTHKTTSIQPTEWNLPISYPMGLFILDKSSNV